MHFNALLKYFWNCRLGGGLRFVFAVSLQHIHHAVFIISCKIECKDCWVMCEVSALSSVLMITPESFFIGFLEASCIHSFLLTQIRSVELAGVREEIYCLHCYSTSTLSCSPHGQIINKLCPHDDGACMYPPRPVLSVNKPFTATHMYSMQLFGGFVGVLLLMPRSWCLANNTL